MKQIRESVFETNSSSTHSVSINHRDTSIDLVRYYETLIRHIDFDNLIHVSYGEFGWGYDAFDDPMNKLSYLITMIGELYNIEGWYNYNNQSNESMRHEMEEIEDYQKVNELIKTVCKCDGIYIDSFNGYIDHQSYEDYHCIDDFLNDWGTDLVNFIFNPNVTVIIDNDNH